MLTATYNTPASDWTRAIDAALLKWSAVIDGDAHFNVEIAFDSSMHYLAMARAVSHVLLGRTGGRSVYLSSTIARFQGRGGSGPDFRITVNPSYPWNFSETTISGKYGAIGVMTHEVGHAFGFHERTGNMVTPFMLEREREPAAFTGTHFAPPSPKKLMMASIDPGMNQHITAHDLDVVAKCGMPLKGRPSIFHMVPGGKVSVARGDHTAVWWGSFAALDADVSACNVLELRGDAPLTDAEGQLYRLYRAAFGRAPDLAGFKYWRAHASTFDQKVDAFCASPEFLSLFAAVDRPTYIRALYRNILGRDPDPGGYAYWTGRSDLSNQQLLAHFALSAENVIGVPAFTLG